jgi:hypothetical protein
MRKRELQLLYERAEGDSKYWQKLYGFRRDEADSRKKEADRLKAQVEDLTEQKKVLRGDICEAETAIDLLRTLKPYPESAPCCQKCGGGWMTPKLIDRIWSAPEHLVWTCECGYMIKTNTKDDTNA